MESEGKKVSFGFSKFTKKPNLVFKPPEKPAKIQLIDCLESQTIKLKGAVEVKKGPLVIPLSESSGNILDKRRELKVKHEVKPDENIDDRLDSDLTADELAARELIRDAQRLNGRNESENKVYSLPVKTENLIEIEGKEESTIENYEAVPISEYGMAMLRGMGWKEGVAIGKNTKSATKVKEPTLRPRGMGLGADKSANRADTQTPALDKDGKELVLKQGGFAKIVEGKQKGNYCEVQGFDEPETGRVIVKTSLQGLILSINQLFVKPVLKEEYAKSSKVINNAKYEEYKSKTEHSGESRNTGHSVSNVNKKSSGSVKDKSSHRHRRNSSEDLENNHKLQQKTSKDGKGYRYGNKKKSKKKHRSSSISSADSDNERRKYKERSRRSSSVSDYEYKKHSSKSGKKSKYKKDYRHRSDSDSDYSYSRSKDTHKKYKHKKYEGRSK